MCRGVARPKMLPMQTISTDALDRLSEDVRAAAWLMRADDPLRGYLVMLAALPADDDAWMDVLAPWLTDLRHGAGPHLDGAERLAAAGALAGAALRASRDMPQGSELAGALRTVARWCFFLVRPDAQ